MHRLRAPAAAATNRRRLLAAAAAAAAAAAPRHTVVVRMHMLLPMPVPKPMAVTVVPGMRRPHRYHRGTWAAGMVVGVPRSGRGEGLGLAAVWARRVEQQRAVLVVLTHV
jgi:hypothetical protein